MNPEEGDLRPQLLDRFALCVEIHGIHDPAARMAVIERNLAFESDPEAFRDEWAPREQALSNEIARARQLLDTVRHTRSDLATIATMMGDLNVDGHRADLVVLKAARAHAAFEGRTYLTDRDILMAAELALPHRLKRHPLQETDGTLSDFAERLSEARAQYPVESEEREEIESQPDPGAPKKV
jgi:Mg-chelatase subunit ChlI